MTRWSCVGLTLFKLEDGRELACSDVTDAALVVSAADADALYACFTPRTLAEHAAATGAPIEFLERAAADGLLVSDEQVVRIAAGRPRPEPPPPSALGIVTRDRPDDLARCLASFRAPEVVVCDDGSGPVPSNVRYAGPAEKARFIDALAAESGVAPPVVAFGLGDVGIPGFRAGGNRNALYLDLVDRLFVSVDDDTVGRLAAPPPRAGAVLGHDSGDFETRVYPDREAALREPEADVDFLAAHGALLGRDLSRLPGLESGAIGPSLARRLRRDGGFAAVTMSGVLGDCASATASWLLQLDPGTVAALAATDEAWEAAKRSREVLRVARRPLLSDQPSLMTYACGYDGRALLPPFAPYGRNEDAVFAFTLLRCVPGALIGHVPVAVLHAAAGARAYSLPAGGSRPGIGELLVVVMASVESSPGIVSADAAYRDVGRHLREMAGLPDADYDDLVRRLLWMKASARIERLERERQEARGCAARGADLSRAIEGLQASLLKPEFVVPADLPGDLAEQRAQGKALMGRFGELLEAWPSIVAAARRLKAQGRRLSR